MPVSCWDSSAGLRPFSLVEPRQAARESASPRDAKNFPRPFCRNCALDPAHPQDFPRRSCYWQACAKVSFGADVSSDGVPEPRNAVDFWRRESVASIQHPRMERTYPSSTPAQMPYFDADHKIRIPARDDRARPKNKGCPLGHPSGHRRQPAANAEGPGGNQQGK